MTFARNISQWSAVKPALYHGHLAYIDFTRFGVYFYMILSSYVKMAPYCYRFAGDIAVASFVA